MKKLLLIVLLFLTGCAVQFKPVILEPLDKFIILPDGWILAAKDTEDRIEVHTKQYIFDEVLVKEITVPKHYQAEYAKVQTDKWKLRIKNNDNTSLCVKIGWAGIDYSVYTDVNKYVYIPKRSIIYIWQIEQEVWELNNTYIALNDAQWKITEIDLQKPDNKKCVS